MYKKLCVQFTMILLFLSLSASPAFTAGTDRCSEDGIIVKNLTLVDLWYKKNNGPCTIWRDNHIFTIKPQDTFDIYSDLVCETSYCSRNPLYNDYRKVDQDEDCAVRILRNCNISDM